MCFIYIYIYIYIYICDENWSSFAIGIIWGKLYCLWLKCFENISNSNMFQVSNLGQTVNCPWSEFLKDLWNRKNVWPLNHRKGQ